MEECEFCVDGSKCLKCHMEAKQELPIRRAYRQEKERHSIEDLEKKNGLKFIHKGEYAVLEFEVLEGTSRGKKTFSFNEFHRHGDENFFGDRPGVYAFHTAKENGKVGESRNLSQRLRTHKGKLMSIGTEGFIVFCCKDGNWSDDPLNSGEMRLTIERILQDNFMVKFTDPKKKTTDPKKKRTRVEKWVTPTPEQLDLAIKICRELFEITGFPKKNGVDSFRLPQVDVLKTH